ncbi:M23 family metallopeptidase [Arthrobacter sp. zg-Y750]|uniref:M23 family metallopeptidase n=1 Tax=Arthrobacter sp. zg-Y750 TaxID=2894189 RepID=UPI001E54EF0D|nr:M23 family metallopeptidase [Arthrobacter sp. zg-Y750]MCC9178895.1 M23 family metallopeptidase [Arthrobacter sp. zg-Y750]
MPNGRFRRVAAALLAAGLAVPVLALPTPPSASALRTPPAAYSPPWSWPLDPVPAPEQIRGFDPPSRRWQAGHRGVDLPAVPGVLVLAPADGRVAFAGVVVNRPLITIDHGGGLKSSFESVEPLVPAGSAVSRGSPVGMVASASGGAGGVHCSGQCLHWGVRLHGAYVNPLNYVGDRRPSVLLPVPDSGY